MDNTSKKQVYELCKEHFYQIKVPDTPLNISISSDGSNAIIATSRKLNLLYFRKLFNRPKQKKILKEEFCDIYRNIGPIQMHPFFDEKEYFAGAYENTLFVIKVSKNSLNTNEAKKFPNKSNEYIKFLSWQNKQNGLLVSCHPTDKILNFYDVQKSNQPVYKLKDDDICHSLKFANANTNLLAAGYNRRLKIFDTKQLLKNKTNLRPIFDHIVFKGIINILDWHSTQNYLLAGSSSEKKIKIYSVKENIEVLHSIFLPNYEEVNTNINENDDKLLTCFFIPGNGIIIVKEKKAFIFNSANNYTEFFFEQKIDFEVSVTHFKIMTNNVNNHYFVYTDKDKNFNVMRYSINENLLNSSVDNDVNLSVSFANNIGNFGIYNHHVNAGKKNNAASKEMENIKRKFPNISVSENKHDKNTFIINLSQDMIIQINIKITFPENYPNAIPEFIILDTQSILFPKYLVSTLTEKISEWKKNLTKNPSLMEIGIVDDLIIQLLDLIEKNKLIITFSEMERENTNFLYNNTKSQENNIIPYPKTCGFCWHPSGKILTFNYHKIDFSNLKKTDKSISNFNDLDDWVQYCKSTDQRKKFSKKENKLFDDDSNLIIYDKFKDLIDVKSLIETEDSAVLLSINKKESLPILFNRNIGMEIQQDHYGNNFNFYNFNWNVNGNDANNNNSLKKNYYSSTPLTIMENDEDFIYEKMRNNNNSMTDSDSEGYNNNPNEERDSKIFDEVSNFENNEGNNMRYQYPFRIKENKKHTRKINYNLTINELDINANKYNFLENVKIRLLSKDNFMENINNIRSKIKSDEASVLFDIIKIIDYNIDFIIDKENTKKNMVKFYKNSIMTTLKTLEKNRNFEFLYLSILLIISRMRDDIDRYYEKLNANKNKNVSNVENINKENEIIVSDFDYNNRVVFEKERKSINFDNVSVKNNNTNSNNAITINSNAIIINNNNNKKNSILSSENNSNNKILIEGNFGKKRLPKENQNYFMNNELFQDYLNSDNNKNNKDKILCNSFMNKEKKKSSFIVTENFETKKISKFSKSPENRDLKNSEKKYRKIKYNSSKKNNDLNLSTIIDKPYKIQQMENRIRKENKMKNTIISKNSLRQEIKNFKNLTPEKILFLNKLSKEQYKDIDRESIFKVKKNKDKNSFEQLPSFSIRNSSVNNVSKTDGDVINNNTDNYSAFSNSNRFQKFRSMIFSPKNNHNQHQHQYKQSFFINNSKRTSFYVDINENNNNNIIPEEKNKQIKDQEILKKVYSDELDEIYLNEKEELNLIDTKIGSNYSAEINFANLGEKTKSEDKINFKFSKEKKNEGRNSLLNSKSLPQINNSENNNNNFTQLNFIKENNKKTKINNNNNDSEDPWCFSLENKKRNLVKVFGLTNLSKFVDFLYHYSNELLKKRKMMERAELMKFLYIITTKLEIDKFNSIFENNTNYNFSSLGPLGNNQKSTTGIAREKENQKISSGKSRYNRILSHLSHEKFDEDCIFKKKLIWRKNEFLKCDICMERMKIDEITVYSPFYNIGGHLNHVIEYGNSFQIFKEQMGRNKN